MSKTLDKSGMIEAGIVAEFKATANREADKKAREKEEILDGTINEMIAEARDLGYRFGRLLRRVRSIK